MRRIVTYGFTEEQIALLTAALPDGYELQLAEMATDIIMKDSVCCIVNAEVLPDTDRTVLQAYYADVSGYACEQLIWIGEQLGHFVCFNSLLDLMLELDAALMKAEKHYTVQSMFCCEYAFLPARQTAETLEEDIFRMLYSKYGKKVSSVIRKQVHQEWTALLEVDAAPELAAVYELTLWLRKNGYPYWVGGCSPSGLIPYLLGITRVNPLPAELGGYNLVWQEYASYGRAPDYVFHLPKAMEKTIWDWQDCHWLKALDPENWEAAQPYEPDHLVRGNMHFFFDAEQTEVPELPHLCREDVFHYLKKHGFVDKDAFRGMCSARKGRGIPVITEEMQNAEDNWILEVCKNVKWLPSRGHLLEQRLFAQRLTKDGTKMPHPIL